MNNDKKDFSYSYSAKDQAELRQIREKYAPPTEEENKMERLRRLDASVTKSAMTVSLTVGIIGALIFGFGMSLCMSDLAEMLGISPTAVLPIGISTGIVGCILAGLAYPIYNAVVKRKRAKIAPEIIRLTDELMK